MHCIQFCFMFFGTFILDFSDNSSTRRAISSTDKPWRQPQRAFLSGRFSRNVVNCRDLSIFLPVMPTALPSVKAAMTVPMPRPSTCPRQKNVREAVAARHITSNTIFIRCLLYTSTAASWCSTVWYWQVCWDSWYPSSSRCSWRPLTEQYRSSIIRDRYIDAVSYTHLEFCCPMTPCSNCRNRCSPRWILHSILVGFAA